LTAFPWGVNNMESEPRNKDLFPKGGVMKITLAKATKTTPSCDLFIVSSFRSSELSIKIKGLDKNLSTEFNTNAFTEGFLGKKGHSYVSSTLGQSPAKAIAFLGLGRASEHSIDTYRRNGGDAYKLAQKKRAKKVAYSIPEHNTVPLFDVTQALAEGFLLASYQFGRYLTKDKHVNYVQELEIHLNEEPAAEYKHALTRAQEIAESVFLARDLINEGPMELNPVKFAKFAEQTAKSCGLEIDILDEKQLKKERMNLLLAVASASSVSAPPRLIRLCYKPKKPSKRIIALVGKGVTFDSGGLDIKPADGMLDMKVDMSGAAAVLGAMRALSKLLPAVNVVAYMGCVENGVGPHAYHPGDIIISRKGLTVEISNTDAEGRLVLADVFDYAQERDKPDTIIDVATLTGACMVALGQRTAGIFSNDDALCQAIILSGQNTGESYWRLPLLKELKEIIKSPIADIKNCGDRYGGSITAALFLEEFINEKVKWAHLDIAGPATTNKFHPYNTIGAVGFAVRTLAQYVMGQK